MTTFLKRALACITFLIALPAAATTVLFETVLGDFEVNLYDKLTPDTVTNFLAYVEAGDFNDTFFHRSVADFILQGGGYKVESDEQFTPMPPVMNEPFLSNQRGTIAMAKLGGNPNSATSQWFFNLGDNSGNLDAQNGGFTVFGEVVGDGMVIVDALAALPAYRVGSLSDFPLRDYTQENADNKVPVVAREHFLIISAISVSDESPDTADDLTPMLTTYTPAKKKSGGAFDFWMLGLLGFMFAVTAFKRRVN